MKYLTGDKVGKLTHASSAKNIIGIKVPREDKMILEDLTSPRKTTNIIFGVDNDTGELGLQIAASQKGVSAGGAQDISHFFTLNRLAIDGALSSLFAKGISTRNVPENIVESAIETSASPISETPA